MGKSRGATEKKHVGIEVKRRPLARERQDEGELSASGMVEKIVSYFSRNISGEKFRDATYPNYRIDSAQERNTSPGVTPIRNYGETGGMAGELQKGPNRSDLLGQSNFTGVGEDVEVELGVVRKTATNNQREKRTISVADNGSAQARAMISQ